MKINFGGTRGIDGAANTNKTQNENGFCATRGIGGAANTNKRENENGFLVALGVLAAAPIQTRGKMKMGFWSHSGYWRCRQYKQDAK